MVNEINSDFFIRDYEKNLYAEEFCRDYLRGTRPRFVFGTNEYAVSIAECSSVDGFIDEFTTDQVFLGKKIVKLDDLPEDALVVSSVVGRPLSVRRKLADRGCSALDYFSFRAYSGLPLKQVKFQDEFISTFPELNHKYNWLFELLCDEESRNTFRKIIDFRLSNNLDYMEGFVDAQDRQYFEDFLKLSREGEVFLDVGCFDGYTSEEFIKRAPNYHSVHVFEPEPKNMLTVKSRLGLFPKIIYHEFGLSNKPETLRFRSLGSASRVDAEGDVEIKVNRLENLLAEKFTFLKMDIEGGESLALEGARENIIAHHPRLAISVYHKVDDFWRIPEQILSYRSDYDIYLRHYTEGVDETVMFFIPRSGV